MSTTRARSRPARRLRGDLRRVLLVSPGYPPLLGGVEEHVSHLARGLLLRGWAVDVATQAAHGEPDQHDLVDGVRVHRFGLTVGLPAYRWSASLHRWLAREARGYSLVHAHSYHGLPALEAARARPAKLVFTPHYNGNGHTALARALHVAYRPLGAAIFRRADAIVCVSPAEAALVQRRFSAAAGLISVIPNGVAPADASVAPFSEPRQVVLYSGRLEVYKKVDVLIRAAAELSDDVLVVITGTGPDAPRLRALAKQLGVGHRVRFTSFVARAELERWQRTSAVYVSLSAREAYNIGAHEAAAAGARVVASDIPPHQDMLRAATPGAVILVPSEISAAALARVIESNVALGRVRSPWPAPTWSDVVKSTVDVYDRALSPRMGL